MAKIFIDGHAGYTAAGGVYIYWPNPFTNTGTTYTVRSSYDWTVNNLGFIGSIYLDAGGMVTNSGAVDGQRAYEVSISGGRGIVINYGTISGPLSAVSLRNG